MMVVRKVGSEGCSFGLFVWLRYGKEVFIC